ncbi:hypothetical protein BDV12DRAFT_117894 [Aspergillus spectabilis]
MTESIPCAGVLNEDTDGSAETRPPGDLRRAAGSLRHTPYTTNLILPVLSLYTALLAAFISPSLAGPPPQLFFISSKRSRLIVPRPSIDLEPDRAEIVDLYQSHTSTSSRADLRAHRYGVHVPSRTIDTILHARIKVLISRLALKKRKCFMFFTKRALISTLSPFRLPACYFGRLLRTKEQNPRRHFFKEGQARDTKRPRSSGRRGSPGGGTFARGLHWKNVYLTSANPAGFPRVV